MCLSKNFSHDVHQRIGSFSTEIPEIIQIQGPDHSSTKAIVLHKVTFPRNGSLVIKPNPLVSVGGVGTHSGWTGVILTSPSRAWLRLNAFLVLACLLAIVPL